MTSPSPSPSSAKAKSRGTNQVNMGIAKINGRPVLQPACNRVGNLEAGRQIQKKPPHKTIFSLSNSPDSPSTPPSKVSLPISPKNRPSRLVLKRGNDPNCLNSSTEKPQTPKSTTPKSLPALATKKSRKLGSVAAMEPSFKPPGSIAAERREQATLIQAQRKMKIAHYGRIAKLDGKVVPLDVSSPPANPSPPAQEQRRCGFLTPNSDPVYVAYHDEEWGVPVHDDKMLFELLYLAGAQVGMGWTSLLKKRQDLRVAFAGFDAEVVANFSEKQIVSISASDGIDVSSVRGVVNNANRILQMREEMGSLDNYVWGFVNKKAIATEYRSWRKVPVKTSKSESISKDMVKKGFRFVGPTVIHSFMQAAGLTNDHLLTCPRHLQIAASAAAVTATGS